MKKTIVLFLSFLMIVSVFSGCAQKETDSNDGQITLTWQSYDSIDKYQAIIDAYKVEKPNITIEFEQVPDYVTKLLTQATSDDLPDLINTNTGTTQILAEAGALKALDVNNLKNDDAYNFSDFWEATETYCTYDGTWYSLPLDGGNYGWVYNKKMFDTVGIQVPEDGFTWAQFEDACKTLLSKKTELGIEYPTIFNDLSSSIDMMYPLITQAGGNYLDDIGEFSWNSEAAVTAFDWVKSLVSKGYIPPIEKLGDGYDALITKFNAGEIAMCRVALWNSTYLNDSDKVDWVAMHSPKGNSGKQAEVLFLNGIGIAETSKHADEALDFIKYLTSEKGLETYLKECPSPQVAVRRSQSALSVSMFDTSKNMQIFNTSLEYGGYINLTSTFNDQQDAITQYFDKIWYNNADVQSTLDELATVVNTYLK